MHKVTQNCYDFVGHTPTHHRKKPKIQPNFAHFGAQFPLDHMSDNQRPGVDQVEDDINRDFEGHDAQIDDEWLRTTPKPKPKLFAYDWARGMT